MPGVSTPLDVSLVSACESIISNYHIYNLIANARLSP